MLAYDFGIQDSGLGRNLPKQTDGKQESTESSQPDSRFRNTFAIVIGHFLEVIAFLERVNGNTDNTSHSQTQETKTLFTNIEAVSYTHLTLPTKRIV